MTLIPAHLIDAVRQAVDVADLVGRYVPLKRSGRSMSACCPFHQEKTPSFHVWRQTGTWKCFGCGKGGNAFSFLMEKEGLHFPEAVRQLAVEAGVELGPEDPDARRHASRRKRLKEVTEWACRHFEAMLRGPQGEPAREYFKRRGLTGETAARFRLGYAPPGWRVMGDAAAREGIGPELLLEAGLVIRRNRRGQETEVDREVGSPDGADTRGPGYEEPGIRAPMRAEDAYDRFRNRVIFPIADVQGAVIAFGARTLGDDEPKYLNSPETPLFTKGRHLYGLHLAKEAMMRTREGAVMEGYTDVLMAHQEGWPVAVAGLGTALTGEQARRVARYVDRLYLLYDGDAAGRRAAQKAVPEFLNAELETRVALLPPGSDPCDLLVNEGLEALRAVVDRSKEAFDHLVDARRTSAEESGVGRDRALAELSETLAGVRDMPRLQVYFRKLLSAFNADITSQKALFEHVLELRRRRRRLASGVRERFRGTDAQAEQVSESAASPVRPASRLEMLLLEAALGCKELRRELGPALGGGVTHPYSKELLSLLAASPDSDPELFLAGLADPGLAAFAAGVAATGAPKTDLLRQGRDCLAELATVVGGRRLHDELYASADRATEDQVLKKLMELHRRRASRGHPRGSEEESG